MNEFKSRNQAVVIIPLYKTDLTKQEVFSIEKTVSTLSNWNIVFVGPKRLAAWIEKLKQRLSKKIKLEVFDDFYFSSVAGYNRLLSSSFFYERFIQYEYILISQTDALIIQDDLSYWCDRGFSYIGAPWFEGFDIPTAPLRMLGVGNGGLSLRRVSDFLRVLSRIRYIPDTRPKCVGNKLIRFTKHIAKYFIFSYNRYPFLPLVNEDFFWGGLVPLRCEFFTIPDPVEAAFFPSK
jgi:hypothetical protein